MCMVSDNLPRRENEDLGEQIYSKAVRAGKRTYYIDVKATRGDDYYLTITESRKKTNPNGTTSFSRHQIYLYKEDFEKFIGGLTEMIEYIKVQKPEYFERVEAEALDKEFEEL